MNDPQSVFPPMDDDFLLGVVDMEFITQSNYSWKEAPAAAVLLAVEVLNAPLSFAVMREMSREVIFTFGNWRSKKLDINPLVRQEMYQRNYEESWEAYYHEDGFSQEGKEE